MKELLSKDRARTAISVIFAFILSLCLFFVTLGGGCIYAVRSEFVLDSFAHSGYAEAATEELTGQLNDLAIPSGLPDDFFSGRFKAEDIKKQMLTCCENILEGRENAPDTAAVQADILNWVTTYSTDTAGELSTATKSDLALFSQECASTYLRFINHPTFNMVLPLFAAVMKYALIAVVAGIILATVCLVLIIRMNSAHATRMYCFAAALGGALTCGVIPCILIYRDELSKIGITSPSLHALVTGFGYDFLPVLIWAAGITASVGIFILAFQIKDLIFKR